MRRSSLQSYSQVESTATPTGSAPSLHVLKRHPLLKIMVRKKQQHPRALLGPQARNADRSDVTRPLAPVPAPADSASAAHYSQVSCDKASVVTSIVNNDADIISLRHLAIDCKELSSITGARAGSQLSLSLTHEAPVIISWNLHGRIPEGFPGCSVSAISTVLNFPVLPAVPHANCI